MDPDDFSNPSWRDAILLAALFTVVTAGFLMLPFRSEPTNGEAPKQTETKQQVVHY